MLNKINCYCYLHLLSIDGRTPACSQESPGRRNGSTARVHTQSILLGLDQKIGKSAKTQAGNLRQKPGFYRSSRMVCIER